MIHSISINSGYTSMLKAGKKSDLMDQVRALYDLN